MGGPVKWPASNASDLPIISTPLCLDHNKQLNVKTCEKDIGWQPVAVPCNFTSISYELSNKCPDNYEPVNNEICVLIHSSQPFMSSCVDSLVPFTIYDMSTSELETFFAFLRNNAPGQKFWLPAKQTYVNVSMRTELRYPINELGLQWTMPAFYGERVYIADDCPTCTLVDHGGCLNFQPILNSDNRFNTSVNNCDLRHFKSFCLFKKTQALHKLACPDGYVAPLMPKRLNLDCFAIRQFDPVPVKSVSNNIVSEQCSQQQAFQLNSVEATFHYALLANQSSLSSDDRCLFAMNPSNVVINESDFVRMLGALGPFFNWDISMGFHDFSSSTNNILSANYLGKWFWESNEVTCIVCSNKVTHKTPSLELQYDRVKDKLTLKLINSDYLMTRQTNNLKFMCFALVHNQYNTNLKATLLSTDLYLYLYDIELIGPGKYWCSGHAIFSGTYLETDRIFAQGVVMSMMVEYHCRQTGCYNFENNFRNFLYNQSYIDPAHISLEDVSNRSAHYPPFVNFVNILFHVDVNIINEAALHTENNKLNLSDEMLTYYYVRQKFLQISNLRNEVFRIRSVNSTDYCLPSSISILSEINWLAAGINETIESVERCIDLNGRPLRRRCVGDKEYGVTWSRLSSESHCYIEDYSDLTDDLENIANNFEDPEQSKEVIESLRHLITNSSDRMVRMDIFLVSQIMGRVSSFLDKRTLTLPELNNLAVIYNNIMLVNPGVARSSATFNSTNVLLESLDLILIHKAAELRNAMIPLSNALEIQRATVIDTMISTDDEGIVISISPMLINFVIDPMLTDISGLAVLKKENSRQFGFKAPGLKDYTVQYLHRNQSQTDLLLQSNLEVASFFPIDLLRDILIANPDAKLVFTIFYNDVLFQTIENTTYTKSDGRIIAVSVPGLEELPGMLPIYVKPERSTDEYCGYWDYNSAEGWSKTGCFFRAQDPTTNIVMCECNHLTHFAYLLRGNSSQFEGLHLRSLQGITVLGCSLSLIGIIGIYITAIQFRSWRSKPSTKYLLQLSTAIAFQMILLAFVNTAPMTQLLLLTNNEGWCIFIGVLLHYFVLAMFFWMLIIAYLQFIRYVIVFNHVKTPRFLLKSSLLGWTLPMIPVLLVVLIDSDTYIPDLYFSESQICYPSGYSLYFGILLPIGVIVGANLVIFILVNYNLLRGTNAVCKAGDRSSKLSQLRLSVFLFFLLGLTWLFGLMSTAFSETSIVFSYLFCLTGTFQGFVMFLYFVVMDPVARNLWIYFFKRICFSKRGNIDIRKDSSSKDSY